MVNYVNSNVNYGGTSDKSASLHCCSVGVLFHNVTNFDINIKILKSLNSMEIGNG